jgi:hypothetical protein
MSQEEVVVGRERRASMSAPLSDLKGPVGPGFSRPKHKRTVTGLAPSEIKSYEASIPEPQRERSVQITAAATATEPTPATRCPARAAPPLARPEPRR